MENQSFCWRTDRLPADNAKIATVISVDIPKLVQRKTDHKVKFQAVTVEEAQELLALEAKK